MATNPSITHPTLIRKTTFPSQLTGQPRELPQVQYIDLDALPEKPRSIARQLLQYGYAHQTSLYDKKNTISHREKMAFKRWLMNHHDGVNIVYRNYRGGYITVDGMMVGIQRDNQWTGQAHWDVFLSLPKGGS